MDSLKMLGIKGTCGNIDIIVNRNSDYEFKGERNVCVTNKDS